LASCLWHLVNFKNPLTKETMKPQTETLLDYLTAIAIGVGMAALLVAWWSA
jgi:hypothetical protein